MLQLFQDIQHLTVERLLDYTHYGGDFSIDLNFMLYDFVLDKICALCNSDDNDQSSMDVLSSVLRDTITVFGNYLDTWYVSHEDELYKNYCENFLSSHPQYIECADKESFLRSSYIATVSRFLSMCEESEEFNKLVEFVGIKEFLSNEIAKSLATHRE